MEHAYVLFFGFTPSEEGVLGVSTSTTEGVESTLVVEDVEIDTEVEIWKSSLHPLRYRGQRVEDWGRLKECTSLLKMKIIKKIHDRGENSLSYLGYKICKAGIFMYSWRYNISRKRIVNVKGSMNNGEEDMQFIR